jgi:hypothetical protein
MKTKNTTQKPSAAAESSRNLTAEAMRNSTPPTGANDLASMAEKSAQKQYVVFDEHERSLTKPMSLGDAEAWAKSPLSTATYKGLHIQPVSNYSSPEKSAHTPGPWRAIWSIVKQHPKHPTWGWFVTWDKGNSRICNVTRQPRRTASNEGEDEANARLIAAAPELLEVLKSVVNDLEYGTTGRWKGEGSKSLRAAIAKVEGRAE